MPEEGGSIWNLLISIIIVAALVTLVIVYYFKRKIPKKTILGVSKTIQTLKPKDEFTFKKPRKVELHEAHIEHSPEKNIEPFIQKALKQGYNLEQIRKALLAKKWPPQIINSLLKKYK